MSDTSYVWYHFSDARSLEAKVQECAKWYRMRYGADANLCLSHPETIGETKMIEGIELRATQTVQPNNFFITRVEN